MLYFRSDLIRRSFTSSLSRYYFLKYFSISAIREKSTDDLISQSFSHKIYSDKIYKFYLQIMEPAIKCDWNNKNRASGSKRDASRISYIRNNSSKKDFPARFMSAQVHDLSP